MLLVNVDVDLTDEKKQISYLAKILGSNVSITSVTSLGKKQLAYTIKKQDSATYLVAELSADAIKADDIEKRTRLNDEILRYMLIVKE